MASYEIGFKPSTLPTATTDPTGTMRFPNKVDFSGQGSSIAAAHLVQSGQKIKGFYVAGKASTSGVPASVFGGAYVTSSNGTTEGARVFGGTLIAITTSAVNQWHYTALDIDLSSFVGQWIKPVARDDASQFRMLNLNATSGGYERSTDNFPDPMGVVFGSTAYVPMYMVIEDSAQSITSINDDDELNSGEANTAEVVGYVVGVNAITSGTVGTLALTSVSQTGTVATFTIPAPINAAYWPEPDTTQTLTLTDGTNAATFNALFNSLAGYTSVVVASPDNADEYKLGYWATTPPVNGDRIMADFTVNPDTSFSGVTSGVHVWYHWVSATSTMYVYVATFEGGEIVTVGGLTVSGLTVSGLTVSGLTVTGL